MTDRKYMLWFHNYIKRFIY